MSPHRRPVPLWYVLLAVMVSILATAGANIAYTSHVQRVAAERSAAAQRESDRMWCELFDIMTAGSPPPTTERGQAIADALERRRATLGC